MYGNYYLTNFDKKLAINKQNLRFIESKWFKSGQLKIQ